MIVRVQIDRKVLQNEFPTIIQNDSFPINFAVLHNDESIFDLSGYEATFKMRLFTTSVLTVDSSATITSNTGGLVSYILTTSDTQVAGLYTAELEVLETTTNEMFSTQFGKFIITEEI